MLPFSASASRMAAAIDADPTIPAPRDPARPAAVDDTPLARALATTKDVLLRSMARDHLALCLWIKRFPDQEPSLAEYEAACVDQLVSYTMSRMASPPGTPPTDAGSWDRSQMAHHMGADLFLRRAAAQGEEAAVCRTLARQLLSEIGAAGPGGAAADAGLLSTRASGLARRLGLRVPPSCVLAPDAATGEIRVLSDPTLLGRSLWRASRSGDSASHGDPVVLALPGSPFRQLRIEGEEWVSITGAGVAETSVRVGDLARIDRAEGAEGARTGLTDHARERVALSAIDASSPGELLAFPAPWVCSTEVASALLDRLDDEQMSRWMDGQPLAQRPEVAERIVESGNRAWRHGLVLANVDRLGKARVLSSLTTRPEEWHDERCLHWTCCLGDAERVRANIAGVLGCIGKGLTADEALSILWRQEERLPPLIGPNGHRCAEAFLDALAPALLDGRLSAEQVTTLIGGSTPETRGSGLSAIFTDGFRGGARQFIEKLQALGDPRGLSPDQLVRIISGGADGRQLLGDPLSIRTVLKGSSTDLDCWYAEILSLWRRQRIDPGQARSLMLGLDRLGNSVWHAAYWRASRTDDAAVIVSLVRAWTAAIEAGLLPRDALSEGLLWRRPRTGRSELACASAQDDNHWLSALFQQLGELKRQDVLPEAEFCQILEATLDIDGLSQAVAEEFPRLDARGQRAWRMTAAQQQLTTFERLLNACIDAQVLDGASAARLLLARPDGQTSRSVRAAAMAGGHSDSHLRLLDDAERRGDLSPAQKADALSAVERLARALHPEPGSRPAARAG